MAVPATWADRDLPVLEAAVALVDELVLIGYPEASDIAELTGLDIRTVATALHALAGDYLTVRYTGGDPGAWGIPDVTPAARRAVGQWPTPESVVDQLVVAMTQAAEHETDPVKSSKLQAAAQVVGGIANAVAVNVLSGAIGQHLPH